MSGHAEAKLPHLAEDHRERIRTSGINLEVACARGYRSVETKAELRRLGFGDAQCRVPALLIPIHGVAGSTVNYQIRPNEPRIKDGKPVKYELPARSQMALDVHPFIRDRLDDPATPLWITEGIFKADAANSAGLYCIAILGVWNWRG